MRKPNDNLYLKIEWKDEIILNERQYVLKQF